MFDALVLASGDGLQLARCLTSLVPGVVDGVVWRAVVIAGPADREAAAVAAEAGCDLVPCREPGGAAWREGLAAFCGSEALLMLDGRVVLDAGWPYEIRGLADRGAFDEPCWAALFDSRAAGGRRSLRERLAWRFGGPTARVRAADAVILPRTVARAIYGDGEPARLSASRLIRLQAKATVLADRVRPPAPTASQGPGAT